MAELLRIALPMVVSQGTFAVMIFTDRYFMSQIDPIAHGSSTGWRRGVVLLVLLLSSDCSRTPMRLRLNIIGAGELGEVPEGRHPGS